MKLDDLHVLHIYHYSKPKGSRCPLKQFTRNTSPLAVSTCMRHIYIFSESQFKSNQPHLNTLTDKLENPEQYQAKSDYDLFHGEEAYAFLLFWIIGGCNPKNPFNDPRILGDLRNTLFKYEHSKNKNAINAWNENKQIANALRVDGKRLLEWVSNLPPDLSYEDKLSLAKIVCKNCAWLRKTGLLTYVIHVDYSTLINQEEMVAHIKEQLDDMEEKKRQTAKKIHSSYEGGIGFLFDIGLHKINSELKRISEFRETLEESLTLSLMPGQI